MICNKSKNNKCIVAKSDTMALTCPYRLKHFQGDDCNESCGLGGHCVPVGYWWCPFCKQEISPTNVTYQEKCVQCGYTVEWKDPEIEVTNEKLFKLIDELFEVIGHGNFSNGNIVQFVDEGQGTASVYIKKLRKEYEELKGAFYGKD